MSSQLAQLVQAEQRGEAVSFARQNAIELIDGKVRVVVETLPGQFEATSAIAADLATVEATYQGMLQVVILF